MKSTNYFQQLIRGIALHERMKQNLLHDLDAAGIQYIEVQDSILLPYIQADIDLTLALYKEQLTD